jgi:hypothetical protein
LTWKQLPLLQLKRESKLKTALDKQNGLRRSLKHQSDKDEGLQIIDDSDNQSSIDRRPVPVLKL